MFRSRPPAPEARLAQLKASQSELADKKRQLNDALSDNENNIANARSEAAANDVRSGGVHLLTNSTITGLNQRRDEIVDQLRILNRAMQLNRSEMDALEAAITRQVTEAARDEYCGIVGEVKAAVMALQAASAKEAEFRGRLERNGGSMGCGVLQSMALNLSFAGWLADAKNAYGI